MKRLHAVIWDKVDFLLNKLADANIRCVVSFNGRIDEDRMRKAVALSLKAEPVLSCRYVEHWRLPYYEPLEPVDYGEVCTLVETADVRSEVDAFLLQPVDALEGPQVRARIVRSDVDTLCVNMHHVVGDAAGMKDYIYLLASIYRSLGRDPEFIPPTNTDGSRGLWQVVSQLSFLDKVKVVFREMRIPRLFKGWQFPWGNVSTFADPVILTLELPASRFKVIKDYGRRYQATLNDVVLTAFHRSLYKMTGQSNGISWRVPVTVDLRRYLPSGEAGAVCNLSNFTYTDLDHQVGASFEETLAKVRDEMNSRKANLIGFYGVPLIILGFQSLPYPLMKKIVHGVMGDSEGRPPTFTNMGALDPGRLAFDGVAIKGAYLTGPVNYPPGFQLGCTSFEETLTFSVCFRGGQNERGLVETFFDVLELELP